MKLGLGLNISNNVWNPTHSAGLEFWFAKATGITESRTQLASGLTI